MHEQRLYRAALSYPIIRRQPIHYLTRRCSLYGGEHWEYYKDMASIALKEAEAQLSLLDELQGLRQPLGTPNDIHQIG
jgi:hypothetical protein